MVIDPVCGMRIDTDDAAATASTTARRTTLLETVTMRS